MGQDHENRKPKHGSAELMLQRTEQCSKWLKKLAGLFRVELAPTTIQGYLELLVAYPSDAMAAACQRVAREWDKASMFPPPAFIIRRIEEHLANPPDRISDSRHILERGSKPPDWEPLEPGELEEMQKRARQVERAVETAAQEKAIQPAHISGSDWEARRLRQLDEFRKRNRETGDV